MIYPNGTTANYTLDAQNRLDLLEYKFGDTSMMSGLDYDYDPLSNVLSLIRDDTGAGGSSKTFTFGYDQLSRLKTANYSDETVTYDYDVVGNRQALTSTLDGVTNYTIAANSNQLDFRSQVPEDADFNTMIYAYDAEGKLTQRSEGNDYDTFSYGFGSRLTQIQKVRGGSVQQTVSYEYDGGGQRVKVTDSGGTQYFLYDGGMPVLELDANKVITARYLYGANGVVYRYLVDTHAYEYHHTNALGSNIVLTDDNENVLVRYEYDVFGAVRNEVGSSDNARKFTGKEWDADVNLYYYSARYYDPYIGRFTSRDPAKDGLNWYVYTANNPLKFVDPTGLKKSWIQTFIDAVLRAFGIPDPNNPLPPDYISGSQMPGVVLVDTLPQAPDMRTILVNFVAEEIVDGVMQMVNKERKLTYNNNKIGRDMRKRGWAENDIQNAVSNPRKTAKAVDMRGGANDPATAYFIDDNHYVVVNDNTGEIVQVANKNDPDWKIPTYFVFDE